MESEHKKEVEILAKIEVELGEMIVETEDLDLMEKFLEWQTQREICNEGFHEFVKSLLTNEEQSKPTP